MSTLDLKIFSGNSNIPLAQEICDYLSVPLGQAQVSSFPDGETYVKINENIRGTDIFLVQSTCGPANHNLMEMLIMIDAMKRASAHRITAVIPFFGYARQDRKDQPRVPITAKLVANLLVASGAHRVLTIDLHSQQLQGFFDIPVDHLYGSSVFYNYLHALDNRDLAVFSPDVGSAKMAAAYADMLKCPLGFVAKRRTGATTVEAQNLVGDPKDKNVLLVDDMTETAGTLVAASNLIKESGAKKITAIVSHGVLNSIGYERLNKSAVDELVTTNTVPVNSQDFPMKVMTVAPLLGEAIKRIHENLSVTSLFKIKGF